MLSKRPIAQTAAGWSGNRNGRKTITLSWFVSGVIASCGHAMTWAGVTPQRRPNKLPQQELRSYHPDRKPGVAQNADRDVRPTDAEAKESKNASSCQKPTSLLLSELLKVIRLTRMRIPLDWSRLLSYRLSLPYRSFY